LKIAIVIEALDQRRGGAENWTWQYVQWLVACGHQVHVLAARFAPAAERLGIVRHLLPYAASRCALADAAAQAVQQCAPDVVHDMGCGWHCDLFQPHSGSRLAAFEQNLRLLPRWFAPLKRRMAPLLPRYRDFAQLVARQYAGQPRLYVALSKMVATHMRHYHGVAAEHIRVVYNGVDVERYSPQLRSHWRQPIRRKLGIEDHELLVLIVAHNHRLKGVPALRRAVACLRRQGRPVRLVVAGGRRQPAARCRRGETLFLGSVDDPAPLYAAADVYAHPTWYDPCSLVVLEALACGLPVVTSQYNGASELMRDGKEGYVLTDPADSVVLAAHLQTLLDQELRQHMGQQARALAEAHTLTNNFRQLAALYQEIARQRRAA
jgi:UDP-glucose:(heptosyl)LPS alpha-1,3-glucosyltransferase